MKTWLIIALLLTGCMKDADNRHIGGLETGPAVIRYLNGTEPSTAQPYVYPARWLLGDLKMQMQLAGIKWGQSDIVNQDGVKIHAQSNQYGLADLDEIWIDMSALNGSKSISIVAFDIYFKQHSNTYNVPERGITYLVGEPYGTTGGGVVLDRARSSAANFHRNVARAMYYHDPVHGNSDTSIYNGYPARPDATLVDDGDYHPVTRQPDGPGRTTEYVRIFQVGESFGPGSYYYVDYGEAAASPYNLYVAPNASFDSMMPDKYKLPTYIGKAGQSIVKTTTLNCAIAADSTDPLYTISRINQDKFVVNNAAKFIPGDYIISSVNDRYLGSGIYTYDAFGNPIYYGIPPTEASGSSLHSDTGGYTLVFTMSNGDQQSYDIDLDFSFDGDPYDPYAFSNTVTAFDPAKGTVKIYSLGMTDNPFFQVGSTSGLTGTWSVVAQPVPSNATPVKTIDVFEKYRKDYIIK